MALTVIPGLEGGRRRGISSINRPMSVGPAPSKTFLPWGEEDTTELITYDVAEDPARSAMHGEASTAVKLEGRTLTWSVELDLLAISGTSTTRSSGS